MPSTSPLWRDRRCALCDGRGCEECDGTGQRVTTLLDLDGGGSMMVHGSVALTPETAEALRDIGDAAVRAMSETRGDR